MKRDVSLPKKICSSWYHKKIFRFVAIVISLGVFLQGLSLVFNIDIMSLIHGSYNLWKVLWGMLYMIFSGWIIYFLSLYSYHRKKTYLLCPHCAAVKNHKND